MFQVHARTVGISQPKLRCFDALNNSASAAGSCGSDVILSVLHCILFAPAFELHQIQMQNSGVAAGVEEAKTSH